MRQQQQQQQQHTRAPSLSTFMSYPPTHLKCCINSRLQRGGVVGNAVSYCVVRRLGSDEKTTATPAVTRLATFAFWSVVGKIRW